MPCIYGPIEPEGLLVSAGVSGAGWIATGNEPHPKAFRALIDTGATRSCISPAVVQAAALVPQKDARGVRTADGASKKSWYRVDLVLTLESYKVVLFNIEALSFEPGGGPCDILIGMDVISQGVLTVVRDRFSFCI